MTVMLTLRFLVRLWFKSLSGSLLIILYYNRTRNRSVNITVIPKKKNKQKKNHGVWNTDAKHYLGMFRLMSNLQVTCVNDRVTCLQLMASVCGTCESYAGIRRKISSMENLSTSSAYYDVCQRTTTYASVLLTYTKLTHTYSTCASVLDKFLIRRHTLAKSSRCDSGFTKVCSLH